jgi:hypothetical protein
MARPASPPGADHAAEQAQDHIPSTLPPPPPDARPASPPGADHAAEQAQDHIPTTLPPEHDDTLVFTALAEPTTLPDHALTNAADHAQEHLPTELPAVPSHEVTLPEAADHMSAIAIGHLPDWLL